jgi:hypothetical protein
MDMPIFTSKNKKGSATYRYLIIGFAFSIVSELNPKYVTAPSRKLIKAIHMNR